MNAFSCPHSRRRFLKSSVGIALAGPAVLRAGLAEPEEDGVATLASPPQAPAFSPSVKATAKVAIVPCRSYGAEFHAALGRACDQLGGLSRLVGQKTVTVKLNLTGTNFEPVFGRHPGESYITHVDSAMALATLLFRAGAKRVRFVESTQRIEPLEQTVADAGWDVKAFEALGPVEWENTRNLGLGKQYATFKVPSGGYMFSSFQFNHSYEDTDCLVSLCKLKNHLTCGVTLALKNMFGLTPNALYGDQAPNERATAGRGPLHERRAYRGSGLMPGEIRNNVPPSPFARVPRIVADISEARPIHLSIIDGVLSMKGGEGPWAPEVKPTSPGVLIVGLNPVSTDAVGTAVMGYREPRVLKGTIPFQYCDNHLLLAEQRGVGVLDLRQIELLGARLEDVVYPYGG